MDENRELIFVGDHDPRKPLSENTVNKALRVMGYNTKTEVCGHGSRTMACSSLIESGLWSRDAVERRLMLQWWADYLDANRNEATSPYLYAKINEPLS